MAFMKTGAPEKQKPVFEDEIEDIDAFSEDEPEMEDEDEQEEADTG